MYIAAFVIGHYFSVLVFYSLFQYFCKLPHTFQWKCNINENLQDGWCMENIFSVCFITVCVHVLMVHIPFIVLKAFPHPPKSCGKLTICLFEHLGATFYLPFANSAHKHMEGN